MRTFGGRRIYKRSIGWLPQIWHTLHNRWIAKTPLIFNWIIRISIGIGSVAFAIQTSIQSVGVDAPEWWLKVLPYLIGAGAGAGVVAKLTQQYDSDNKPIKSKRPRTKSHKTQEEWENTL